MGLHPLGQAVEIAWAARGLPGGHQTQMPLRHLQILAPGQAAQHRRQTGNRANRLPQKLLVPAPGDPIKQDAGEFQPRIKAAETLHQGGGAAGLSSGVHHQQNSAPQPAGYLRGAPLLAVAGRPVEEPHHSLDDRQVRVPDTPGENPSHPGFAAHPAVQVPGNPAGRPGVMAGIDEIRTDFERRHLQPPAPQGGQHSESDRGFAASAGRGGDDQRTHGGTLMNRCMEPKSNLFLF